MMNSFFSKVTVTSFIRQMRGGSFTLLLFLTASLNAQTWNEDFLNQPVNVQYESSNPVRLNYNAIRNFAVADIDYRIASGDFRHISTASDERHLRGYIGGLRQIGRLNVQGSITYQNNTDLSQQWGNTLWNLPDNPYVFCDSVPGDASTETFALSATGTYAFSDRFSAGLSLGLQTGSRADQTDPRPRTTSSLIPITIGLDYGVNKNLHVGLSGGITVFSSFMEYYNVQPLMNHRYFMMKGMSDYVARSTVDDSGYKRDYDGLTFSGQLQVVWQPEQSSFANFFEAGYTSSKEDALDGGTSYSFQGGDYSQQVINLRDRFQLYTSDNVLHNLTLSASLMDGKGWWYEQKRETDYEHGNIQYYRTLAKSINHKVSRVDASITYQLDFLRNRQRDLYFAVTGGFSTLTRKQLLGSSTPKQDISLLRFNLKAGKSFNIRRVNLLAQLQGGYTRSLNQKYATGSTQTGTADISEAYARRIFDYESATYSTAGVLLDAHLPVSNRLVVGIYAHANIDFYTGDESYWNTSTKPKRTSFLFGSYLQF